MRAWAWNCQGLKFTDSPTISFLKWLVSSQMLNFMFLSETKCQVKELEDSVCSLGFSNWAGHDANDLSMGLILC